MGSAYLWSHFFIHAMLCPLFFSSPMKVIGGNVTDRLSLLEFKAKITRDPFGVMSSWNDSIHFCQWYGVTCGRRHQRVTRLNLNSSTLAGSISPHIGNLSFLKVLALQNNSLSGEIPTEVGRIWRMQIIVLANNSFSGEIPANISGCTNLIGIDFGSNKLVGNFPRGFASLSRLQYISVYRNNLMGGIPPFFGNFSSLWSLDVSENSLVGSIPEALNRLKNLEFISVAVNYLSGTIPPSLFNISSITTIVLVENQFQGTLPSDLGTTLPNLETFSIGLNQFTGPIPVSISNATNLFQFSAPVNNLIGKVPTLERKMLTLVLLSFSYNNLGTGEDDLSFFSSMANATSLRLLALNANNFQGFLPESVANLSITLETLALNSNKLFGTIPTGILKLKNLQLLYLHQNKLTGAIPLDIGMLKNLQSLSLSANKLFGKIPSSIGNLSFLLEMGLADNNFQGQIPSSIGKCHNLLGLDLSHNNLTGTIPKELTDLSSLSLYLDLSNNNLNGSLPNNIGNLINLGEFNVSHNMLSGDISSSLGSCIKLETLAIQENFFQGIIPSALSSLRGLKVLDLSRNNLTGQIPVFLKNLTYLNLSFNNFDGAVPVDGVFKNASATSIIGNSKLCGGIPDFHLPICKVKESNKKRTFTVKFLIIISGILGITSLLYFLYRLLVQKKKSMRDSNSSGFLQISYQNLLRATDGFSSAKLIGRGNFGSVYKGILEEDGTVVAVKVLNLLQPGASKSFTAECKAWRNIRHRNLVRICTVCSSIDYHGNDFKALVYDFMTNGSLEEWLHPSHTMDMTHEAPKALNFLQRINIAVDMACALYYLHHQCETPIVHCDLKPSNVLLDRDMTAHVGDFGLARFLQEANHVSESSSIGVRGTVGYAPPEYGMGSEVSMQGDVYSYGILLLEMFTGKSPIADMFKEDINLHKFVRAALPERVAEITDPILLQEIVNGEISQGNRFQKCLISIFEIGVSCSAEFPQERMNMTDVAAQLNSIRKKLSSV